MINCVCVCVCVCARAYVLCNRRGQNYFQGRQIARHVLILSSAGNFHVNLQRPFH